MKIKLKNLKYSLKFFKRSGVYLTNFNNILMKFHKDYVIQFKAKMFI